MPNTANHRAYTDHVRKAARIATDRIGLLETEMRNPMLTTIADDLVKERDILSDILHELVEALALL